MITILKECTKQDLEDWIYNINEEDKNLYIEANNPNKIGIFQLNGKTAEKVCNNVKPKNFDELVAISAIARPGPLETCAPYYIERKESGKSPYPKEVEKILKESHFTFLYQEQIMETFHKIGGFTLEEADGIRNLMKKLSKAEKAEEDLKEWDKAVKKFIRGAAKFGIDESMAIKISQDLQAFSGYSFNKCFTADSIIDKDNKTEWSPTIEEMWLTKNDKSWAVKNGHKNLYKKYNSFGYGKAYSIINNRAFLNEIVDITNESEREVFQIILDNEKHIQVTGNHKFPVKNNNYKSIESGLSEGDELFCKENYKQEIKYNFSNYTSLNRPFKKYSNKGFLSEKENSGYINGEYIKFVNNRNQLLKVLDDKCPICYKKTKRLEYHHKDGNRRNNEKLNLLICCSNCHKKFDYQLGKRRKNEKGLPLESSKIKKIYSIGIKRTYNIEMASPYHTVSVNGIMASNSHSTSYSYIALITLYLSYYFREYFYSSVLTYEMDRDKYLVDRINSVRKQGIELLPPDINSSDFHFKPVGTDKIKFGLNDIKFVGEKAVNVILEERENGKFASLIDFYIRTKGRAMTSKVLQALISVGCFDWQDKNRKKLLQTIKSFWENKKSNKVEEKLRAIYSTSEKIVNSIPALETTMEDLVEYEKTFFGVKVFSSLFIDNVLKAITKLMEMKVIYPTIDDINERSMKLPVIINSVRNFTDKNGNEMAFINIEDQTGKEISVPVFQSYWKHIKEKIIQGKLYLINVYKNDESIIFGQSSWTDSDFKIKRMIKRIGK